MKFYMVCINTQNLSKRSALIPTLHYTKRDPLLSSKIELEEEKKAKNICRTYAMIATTTINNVARLYKSNLKHSNDFEDLD
jgi:hypothetical protein